MRHHRRPGRTASILRQMRFHPLFAVVLFVAVTAGGCAHRVGYASWDHFTFSAKATWQEFVGWTAVASSDDEKKAQIEGGWWGEEVPVLPSR